YRREPRGTVRQVPGPCRYRHTSFRSVGTDIPQPAPDGDCIPVAGTLRVPFAAIRTLEYLDQTTFPMKSRQGLWHAERACDFARAPPAKGGGWYWRIAFSSRPH